MTNKERFQAVVKGQNFMTPDVLKFGQQGDYVYELSRGSAFNDEMYGVTVVDLRTNQHRQDLSNMLCLRHEQQQINILTI